MGAWVADYLRQRVIDQLTKKKKKDFTKGAREKSSPGFFADLIKSEI